MRGELRAYDLLRAQFPLAHWVRIETWTGPGVLDVNGCLHGAEVWVECKKAKVPANELRGLYRAKVRPAQIAWEHVRRQAGGRTFVALMVGTELYLLPGYVLPDLKRGVQLTWLRQRRINIVQLFVA